MNSKHVEILAPAGSIESLQASFKAGADAVYMGGSRFGARAYANNPQEDELINAIDYAHIRGKKVYLTVNTLVKEREIEELVHFLKAPYEAGLDAVIVQDAGVLKLINEIYKDIPIHVSTQAGFTQADAISFYPEQVTRIVPARELTIEEIRELKKKTGKELEVFVHGALCYGYSGQCMFSSMCGDRSGNRGRCAQPCRQPYKVVKDNKVLADRTYILSPRDMYSIYKIPELIEAGVDSFKIEGRMKSTAYACGVSEIYKWAIDIYYKYGKDGYYNYLYNYLNYSGSQLEENIIALQDLFNRGGFTEGYAFAKTGSKMMSIKRPNHHGVYVGDAEIRKGIAYLKLTTPVYKGDVLEIRDDSIRNAYSYTLANDVQPFGKEISFRAVPKESERYANGKRVKVYRIKCEQLLNSLEEKYINPVHQILIDGEVCLEPGKQISISLQTKPETVGDKIYKVEYFGEEVQKAQKAPISEESVKEKILRTGDAAFKFNNLKVVINGNAFVPKSMLGELRRLAFEKLEKEITDDYRRSAEVRKTETSKIEALADIATKKSIENSLSAVVFSKEQLKCALSSEKIGRIILDMESADFFDTENAVIDFIKQTTIVECCNDDIKQSTIVETNKNTVLTKKIYLRTNQIADKKTLAALKKNIENLGSLLTGVYAKNISALMIINELKKDNPKIYGGLEIIADKYLYILNSKAYEKYIESGISAFVISPELAAGEIAELFDSGAHGLGAELNVYGKEQLMISRQCVKNSLNKCNSNPEWLSIYDYTDSEFIVYSSCKQCRSLVFKNEPLDLSEEFEKISEIGINRVLLTFTNETGDEMNKIIDRVYSNLFELNSGKTGIKKERNTNTGHFYKGIQ